MDEWGERDLCEREVKLRDTCAPNRSCHHTDWARGWNSESINCRLLGVTSRLPYIANRQKRGQKTDDCWSEAPCSVYVFPAVAVPGEICLFCHLLRRILHDCICIWFLLTSVKYFQEEKNFLKFIVIRRGIFVTISVICTKRQDHQRQRQRLNITWTNSNFANRIYFFVLWSGLSTVFEEDRGRTKGLVQTDTEEYVTTICSDLVWSHSKCTSQLLGELTATHSFKSSHLALWPFWLFRFIYPFMAGCSQPLPLQWRSWRVPVCVPLLTARGVWVD